MNPKATGQTPVPTGPGLPAELSIQGVFHRAEAASATELVPQGPLPSAHQPSRYGLPLSGQAQGLENASEPAIHLAPNRDAGHDYQALQPGFAGLRHLDQLTGRIASNQVANLLSGIPAALIESVKSAAQQSDTVIVLDRAKSQSNFRAMHDTQPAQATQLLFVLPDGRTYMSTSNKQTLEVVNTLADCGFYTAPLSLWPQV